MVTCKECIHYKICVWTQVETDITKTCEDFKNKTDFVEVKHGEWIAHYNGSMKPIYRCSVCNERLVGYSDPNKVPYCHCGAKMDGRSDQ